MNREGKFRRWSWTSKEIKAARVFRTEDPKGTAAETELWGYAEGSLGALAHACEEHCKEKRPVPGVHVGLHLHQPDWNLTFTE